MKEFHKVQESRLKWCGHVLRRKEYVGKGMTVMEVPGKRRIGRPRRKWLDSTRKMNKFLKTTHYLPLKNLQRLAIRN